MIIMLQHVNMHLHHIKPAGAKLRVWERQHNRPITTFVFVSAISCGNRCKPGGKNQLFGFGGNHVHYPLGLNRKIIGRRSFNDRLPRQIIFHLPCKSNMLCNVPGDTGHYAFWRILGKLSSNSLD
jgi:hypothetical protein